MSDRNTENLTLYGQVARTAAKRPDKTAIIQGDQFITYKEFIHRINGVAHDLIERDLKPGSRVCIGGVKKSEFLVGMIACFAIGALPVPISGRDDESETYDIIQDCKAEAVITSMMNSDVIRKCIPGPLKIISPVAELRSKHSHGLRFECELDDDAMIFYTSGTTSGMRKGVIITHKNLSATVNYMNNFMGLNEEAFEYVFAPINHAFGFGRCRAVLKVGGTLAFDEGQYNPGKIVVAIKKLGCNTLSSVSTTFAILAEYFEKYIKPIGENIKWIEIGSLTMKTRHKEKLLDLFPNAIVCMNYGLTEAMRSTLINLREERNKIGTVGKGSPGVEISIRDENGERLLPGQTSEICVRGDNLARGYLDRKELWLERCFGSWFRTGDLGKMDSEGYVTFLGRKDDLINIGGYNLNPMEVEQQLTTTLGNRLYCIISLPDSQGIIGEIPVLCVEGKSPITLDDVTSSLGDIEDYKKPRKVIFIESFPKTQNGKIKRSALKRLITERRV